MVHSNGMKIFKNVQPWASRRVCVHRALPGEGLQKSSLRFAPPEERDRNSQWRTLSSEHVRTSSAHCVQRTLPAATVTRCGMVHHRARYVQWHLVCSIRFQATYSSTKQESHWNPVRFSQIAQKPDVIYNYTMTPLDSSRNIHTREFFAFHQSFILPAY